MTNVTSALLFSILIGALVAGVVAYLWPRPEIRFERLLIATFGALVGSLLGRITIDPTWLGHVIFVTGGAFAFSALDWIGRGRRSRTQS